MIADPTLEKGTLLPGIYGWHHEDQQLPMAKWIFISQFIWKNP
jgi:hypothetical protein